MAGGITRIDINSDAFQSELERTVKLEFAPSMGPLEGRDEFSAEDFPLRPACNS